MGTLKAEADALRLGLIVGLVDRQDVVVWADQVIRSDRTAEAPVVLDLAVGAQQPIADIVSPQPSPGAGRPRCRRSSPR